AQAPQAAQGHLEDARRGVRRRSARGGSRAARDGGGQETHMSTQVHPAAFVDEGARLGSGVTVGPGAVIGPPGRVGDGTTGGSHALVGGGTKTGRACRIHHAAAVGSPPQDLKYSGEASYLEVGDRTEIREFVTANLATEPGATTRIGSDCLLMAYSHV